MYSTFVDSGPGLDYATGGRGAGTNNPTYEDLMQIDDGTGQTRSYLANEENYRFVRDLQRRNLIVPLVGDFAGPKTIRAVGQYLKDHGATVTAFYVSNVERYLFSDYKAAEFYSNVGTLPLDSSSTFIRSFSGGGFGGHGFDQGGLADARLARDEHEPPIRRGGAGQRGAHGRQFVVAAVQRG